MHHSNIDAVRLEVLRLLKGQQAFLTNLLETKDLLRDEKRDKQKRILDRGVAENWLKTCESEIAKVERLEMTLAVVGTMKAGKSTTINAIVGTEVLPNRNRPMTTLPTLIRHRPGQVVPRLTFPAPQYMDAALKEIRARLVAHLDGGTLANVPFYSASKEGRELIEAIVAGNYPALDQVHEGPEAIFEFLEFLNDITRLCRDEMVDVASPLGEYDTIDEFPIIEVEFFHLRHAKAGDAGQFTLVDTPGPNEAGQSERLTKILHEQLEQASAVLAVLDYTQLGSQADEEVRDALEEIARRSGDHLFVLVNKFDAADRNSMDFEEVRQFVVKRLLDEAELDVERVYPVSSNAAYLANRALHTLEVQGALPDAAAQPWVEDFGEHAFGKRWTKSIGDAEAVREGAEDLWKDSKYEKPLEDVIRRSHSRAALTSVESAVAKMREYNQCAQEVLNVRSVSLQKGVEEVRASIDAIASDIQKVQRTRELAEGSTRAAVEDFTKLVNAMFHQSGNRLQEELEHLFKAGKKDEQRRREAELSAVVPQGDFSNIAKLVGSLFPKPSAHTKKAMVEIDPNRPNRFDDEHEAKKFRDMILKAAEGMIGEWTEKTQKATSQELTRIEKNLMTSIKREVAPVLKEAEKRLNEGFGAKLQFPEPAVDVFEVDFDVAKSAEVQKTTESRTRYRTERRWYTLWLKEHEVAYSVNVDVFEVDARKIGEQILKGLAQEKGKIEGGLKVYAEKELLAKANEYIDQLANYLEGYRGTLLDAKEDLERKGTSLVDLQSAMEGLRSQASEQGEDLASLERGLGAPVAGVPA